MNKGASSRRQGRILAFQGVYSRDMSGAPAENVLSLSWVEGPVLGEIRVFAQLLMKGVWEHQDEIDELIRGKLKNWDFDRIERVVVAILRISVYALVYQKDIPPKVTIDEGVEIAKEFAGEDSFRFVNGILDSVQRDCG